MVWTNLFSKLMPITWLDKIDGLDLGDPQKNVNAADMNQIKTTVNANETTLGGKAATSSFVENEVPGGAVNGINVNYSISFTPVSEASVKIYKNGMRQKGGGVDYSVSGTTIVMATAPETGDLLLVDYRK